MSNMPVFHPSHQHLQDYAQGTLSEGLEIIVASHLTLCPACREAVAGLEERAALDFESFDDAELEHAFEELESHLPVSFITGRENDKLRLYEIASELALPVSVVRYLIDSDRVQPSKQSSSQRWSLLWDDVLPGVKRIVLEQSEGKVPTQLIWLRAGMKVPSHGHASDEVTIVLKGAIHEDGSRFGRGDIASLTKGSEHEFWTDKCEDCVCIVAKDGPIIQKTLLGKIGHKLWDLKRPKESPDGFFSI